MCYVSVYVNTDLYIQQFEIMQIPIDLSPVCYFSDVFIQ